MTPSKEAIEAAEQKRIESGFAPYRVQTESMLQAAYAIDFAALQQQLENITKERNNFWKFYTDTHQENERLKAEKPEIVKCPPDDSYRKLAYEQEQQLDQLRALLCELAEALKASASYLPPYVIGVAQQARAALARAEEVLK